MDAQFFKDIAKQAQSLAPRSGTRFPPSPYYRFFWLLAATIHPTLSVELGTCGGGGTFHLATGWPDGRVVAIDKADDYPDNMAFIKANCPNVSIMRGDSVDLAHKVGAMGSINILFIDTVHTYEQTWDEFNAYQPYLAHDAVVCLDDMFRPGMSQVWSELPGHKLRLDKLHIGGAPTDGGFGVIWFQ